MGWIRALYGSSIGRKFVVAVTGAIMVLFLLGHMLGNLQLFAGPGAPGIDPDHPGENTHPHARLNEYARFLRIEMPILWTIRIVLFTCLVLHVWTTVLLTLENNAARPRGYAVKSTVQASLASRTMIWGGLAMGAYIVYHIMHFTMGVAHPDLYVHGDVYGNVIRSFQKPPIVTVYVLAQVFLYFHLQHGVLSLFQTLGVSHPRYLDLVGKLGALLALVITLGFVAAPLGVLFGAVKL